jgi:hypothetical protein
LTSPPGLPGMEPPEPGDAREIAVIAAGEALL